MNCLHNFDYGYKNSITHSSAQTRPLQADSTEFKRAVVAKSFADGASVARLAREFNIKANQVSNWRKQFADLQCAVKKVPARHCYRSR